MANAQGISTPVVLVNNEQIEYVPNSLSYTEGTGERMVNTQVVGNARTTIVVAEDAESAKSKVMFSLRTTAANIDFLDRSRDLIGEIVIQISDARTGLNKAFQSMTLINDPEVNIEADGQIELEFEGARAA